VWCTVEQGAFDGADADRKASSRRVVKNSVEKRTSGGPRWGADGGRQAADGLAGVVVHGAWTYHQPRRDCAPRWFCLSMLEMLGLLVAEAALVDS
jgi:hypothetical protein